jgi:hypothetical protein
MRRLAAIERRLNAFVGGLVNPWAGCKARIRLRNRALIMEEHKPK